MLFNDGRAQPCRWRRSVAWPIPPPTRTWQLHPRSPTQQPALPRTAAPVAGVTPLHIACWLGHAASVQALLEAGANPEVACLEVRSVHVFFARFPQFFPLFFSQFYRSCVLASLFYCHPYIWSLWRAPLRAGRPLLSAGQHPRPCLSASRAMFLHLSAPAAACHSIAPFPWALPAPLRVLAARHATARPCCAECWLQGRASLSVACHSSEPSSLHAPDSWRCPGGLISAAS